MPLFMPTNITPSTLGPFGNAVLSVYSSIGSTVSWQVNGNEPMQAFQISIYSNDSASTLLYTTGKLTDGCPFYGTDAEGNHPRFSYTIPAGVLPDAGLRNGREYKLVITQWWGSATDAESITQQSASKFITRSPASVRIPMTPGGYIFGRTHTFDAVYTQAQGDAILWVRWRLFSYSDLSNPIYDTGEVNTQQLLFTFNGFVPGERYTIRCTVETVNGRRASSPDVSFLVESSEDAYEGQMQACARKDLCGVQLKWTMPYLIPADGAGASGMKYTNGRLVIERGERIQWSQVNGTNMSISGPWRIAWSGKVTELPVEIFRAVNVSDVERISVRIDRTGVSVLRIADASTVISEESIPMEVRIGDELTVLLTNTELYVSKVSEIGTEVSLYPSETRYPSETLYPKQSRMARVPQAVVLKNPLSMTIERFILYGPQICRYAWIFQDELSETELERLLGDDSYVPTFTIGTRFLTHFSAQSDRGGNVTLPVVSVDVYRRLHGESVYRYVNSVRADENTIVDCAARSLHAYTYHIFMKVRNARGYTANADATPCFWDWSILSCSGNDASGYTPKEIYRFGINLETGEMNNNNSPAVLQNFTRYPTVLLATANYKSGSLSGYIGRIGEQGEYSDTLAQRDGIFGLSTTQNALFLKSRKGDLFRIRVTSPTKAQTNDNTRQQMQKIGIEWTEVGDVSNARISIRSGSELFTTTQ